MAAHERDAATEPERQESSCEKQAKHEDRCEDLRELAGNRVPHVSKRVPSLHRQCVSAAIMPALKTRDSGREPRHLRTVGANPHASSALQAQIRWHAA